MYIDKNPWENLHGSFQGVCGTTFTSAWRESLCRIWPVCSETGFLGSRSIDCASVAIINACSPH
jgi:hypothetical protein